MCPPGQRFERPGPLVGALDERPDEKGIRLRDTQCGLFATGKVLRRFRVPFTYMTNCRLDDPVFERGIKDFLAVCNVVKTSATSVSCKSVLVLTISGSTMCNEGELLEKFNIQLAPIPMPELTEAVAKAKAEKTDVEKAVATSTPTWMSALKMTKLKMWPVCTSP